jgi:non-canonical (house-cleaning) NTP pyrophosphatase
MRFSCQEIEKAGFVHDVFECTRCRSTQSYVTPERPSGLEKDRRGTKERRSSGRDTRSEAERHLVGERRSQIDARFNQNKGATEQPSKDQVSLFVKRVRRAMRDDKSRHFFGVSSGEDDFRGHADVLRCLEWIENLARDS